MTRLGSDGRRRVRRLISRDGDGCVWCGHRFGKQIESASVDHVIPRLHGGSSVLDNLVLACRGCNTIRGSMKAMEFLRRCETDPSMRPDRHAVCRAVKRAHSTPWSSRTWIREHEMTAANRNRELREVPLIRSGLEHPLVAA